MIKKVNSEAEMGKPRMSMPITEVDYSAYVKCNNKPNRMLQLCHPTMPVQSRHSLKIQACANTGVELRTLVLELVVKCCNAILRWLYLG